MAEPDYMSSGENGYFLSTNKKPGMPGAAGFL